MKEQKILHIVSSLNIGGAERFVIDLSRNLNLEGFNAEILSFGEVNDKLVGVAKALNIKVHCINNAASPLGQIQLLRVLFGCDVIHLHTPRAIKVLSIAIKLIGQKTLVYTRHGAADLSSDSWQKLHKKFKPYVNHMTFVSQESLDVFTNVYPWEDISMDVVDNGVLIPVLTTPINENILRLGSVGRFVPLKNQISLLKAIVSMNKKGKKEVEVHFFGDGECARELSTFVTDNALSDQVKFHGMVQDREIIYTSFDVLCVTSETEGLSLAIMEAMAFALPVIATNVGGNPKLVHPQKSGWLFEYDDVNSLCCIIEDIIEEPNISSDFGNNGREFIKNNMSIQVATKKYLELYSLK